MTKIVFRQKTPEEAAADAAAKQRREPAATKVEDRPSPAQQSSYTAEASAPPAVAAEGSSFALEPEPLDPEPRKGRRKAKGDADEPI